MSGRGTHQVGGLVAGLAVAQATAWKGHAGLGEAVFLAGTAFLTAGGVMSPDVDLSRTWRALDRWLPDEWLGAGGPLQHRGVTHWWGTILVMAAGWWLAATLIPPLGRFWPLMAGQVAGWASHLALDAICGLQVRATDGAVIVRAGVPMMPWWGHRGGLIRSSDIGSQTIGIVLGVVAVGQVLLMAGGVS